MLHTLKLLRAKVLLDSYRNIAWNCIIQNIHKGTNRLADNQITYYFSFRQGLKYFQFGYEVLIVMGKWTLLAPWEWSFVRLRCTIFQQTELFITTSESLKSYATSCQLLAWFTPWTWSSAFLLNFHGFLWNTCHHMPKSSCTLSKWYWTDI